MTSKALNIEPPRIDLERVRKRICGQDLKECVDEIDYLRAANERLQAEVKGWKTEALWSREELERMHIERCAEAGKPTDIRKELGL